jgi:motility quorum-sensing regulator / GCU-specific mRNA interferase toxin
MIEKRLPHHNLADIKSLFSTPARLRMTGVAQRDARALGYDAADVVRVIQQIGAGHFYKSMTSNYNSLIWQDVYHVPDGGLVLYVKFTDNAVAAMTVLSFKEK